MSGARQSIAALLGLGLLGLLVGAGWASTGDSSDWDGFARWVRSMRTAEITVEVPERIDLSTVPPGAGLAFLDPPTGEIEGLRLFVQEGGRVLLAVESVDGRPLLEAFGLSLAPAPPRGGARSGGSSETGHPALWAFSTPGGGLFTGVDEVVANRPSALGAPAHLDPAVTFADGTPFAYHLQLGEGELLVMGDASLFINLMLDAGDNARLAANLAGWLSGDGRRPVWIAGPGNAVDGQYGDDPAGGEALAGLNRALGDLGRLLDPDDLILHMLLALLLAATVVYAVAVFPGGSHPPPQTPLAQVGRAERMAGEAGGPAAGPAAQNAAPSPSTESKRAT